MAKTFQVLQTTRNEAALDLLLNALESPDSEMQLAALRCLLERRSATGHQELLQRWATFPVAWRAIISKHRTRLEGALRTAILGTDIELHRNACDAILELREFDLLPTLVKAAEDRGNPAAAITASTVLNLCEFLYMELAAHQDQRARRDPVLTRRYVFDSLRLAVERFEQHSRPELVEAFLLLAPPDNHLLKRCLDQPHDSAHGTVVSLLSGSIRPGVLRLIMSFLEDAQASSVTFGIVARRRDAPFVQLLFSRFSDGVSAGARSKLKKIDAFAWLGDDHQTLLSLSREQQRGMVRVAVASGLSRWRLFELLKTVMVHGGDLARRAACEELAEFKGGDANQLVITALDDSDPLVQAEAVGQIRERGIPGALHRLVEMVDSPHEAVRNAARGALTEFNFQRYLSAFELIAPDVRRRTGELVKRVDPLAIDQLVDELVAQSRSRRLRGIEVAVAIDAVQELESYIVQLAHDADHFIRAEAAHALVHANSELSRLTLQELLLDRSMSVQEAAIRSIETLSAKTRAPSTHSPTLPLSLPDIGLPQQASSESLP